MSSTLSSRASQRSRGTLRFPHGCHPERRESRDLAFAPRVCHPERASFTGDEGQSLGLCHSERSEECLSTARPAAFSTAVIPSEPASSATRDKALAPDFDFAVALA